MNLKNIFLINTFSIILVVFPFSLPIITTIKGLNIATNENPQRIRTNSLNKYFIKVARKMYFSIPLREIVQYNNDCFQTSEELIYSPIINSICFQNNYEYLIKLEFGKYSNRLDEQGFVNKPNILVLGDSHAMGWGVSNKEIFTSILNKEGFKTINLSVSSYGTARELLKMKRWAKKNSNEFKNVHTVIIQYCQNDISENKKFLENPKQFITNSRKEIKNFKNKLGIKNKYHLSYKGTIKYRNYGFIIKKYYSNLLNSFNKKLNIGNSKRQAFSQNNQSSHAKLFFNVLNNYSDLIKGKRIIVFVSNGYGIRNNQISKELIEYYELNPVDYLDYFTVLSPKDTLLKVNSDSYYLIDDHISPIGHSRLGYSLVNHLKKNK